MKRTLVALSVILFFSCIHSCTQGQPQGHSNLDSVLTKQVLLTNNASFKGEGGVNGASSFLINYNNAEYAVTAEHLIEPLLKKDLPSNFIKWEMTPRHIKTDSAYSVEVNCDGIDYSKSLKDVILLNVKTKKHAIQPLIPKFELPEVGDTLYLVGCAYSDRSCKQNVYKAVFLTYLERESMMYCEFFDKKVNLMGFSGAPLLNRNGEVLGILIGGGNADGKQIISATFIDAIKQLK